jgi:curved DNA-binding protein CbpA
VTTDPNIHPYWAAETKELAARLDKIDYFELLGCEHDVTGVDLKARYHALQREYHPDTFFQSPDTELKHAVFLIAKRIAEAYVILRNDEKRAKYTRDIQGPERPSKLRFTDQDEQEVRREKQREKEEVLGKTIQGRQLVQKALNALKVNDLAGAARDLQTALLFESGNDSIKNRLAEVKQLMDAQKGKK